MPFFKSIAATIIFFSCSCIAKMYVHSFLITYLHAVVTMIVSFTRGHYYTISS